MANRVACSRCARPSAQTRSTASRQVSFDLLVSKMAEKWREAPGGSDQHPRHFSDQLLDASDADLMAIWSSQFDNAGSLRGWYWKLYGELLRGRRVLGTTVAASSSTSRPTSEQQDSERPMRCGLPRNVTLAAWSRPGLQALHLRPS
jgi:hypothetical protein